jgi:hypothetical protein
MLMVGAADLGLSSTLGVLRLQAHSYEPRWTAGGWGFWICSLHTSLLQPSWLGEQYLLLTDDDEEPGQRIRSSKTSSVAALPGGPSACPRLAVNPVVDFDVGVHRPAKPAVVSPVPIVHHCAQHELSRPSQRFLQYQRFLQCQRLLQCQHIRVLSVHTPHAVC